MDEKMDEKIDEAILNAVAMVRSNCKPDEALKFSQAALNLAHVKGVLVSWRGQLSQLEAVGRGSKTKGASA